MRLHSTLKSTQRGEITALAIAECAISVLAYGVLCNRVHSLMPFEIALSIAPLFLFRTDWSQKLCLIYCYRLNFIFQVMNNIRYPGLLRFIVFFSWCFIYPVIVVLMRIYSNLAGLIRHPVATVEKIPENWVKNALCTDTYLVPELVPGEHKLSNRMVTFALFLDMIRDIRTERNAESVIALLLAMPILFIGYIPSLIMRVSFKASSIAYLPMIFIASSAGPSKISLKTRLKLLVDGKLEQSRRAISLFMLLFIIAKLGLFLGQIDINAAYDYTKHIRILHDLISSPFWPTWLIILSAEPLITYLLYWYASYCLILLETEESKNFIPERRIIISLIFIRGLLAIVVLLASFGQAAIAVVTTVLLRR